MLLLLLVCSLLLLRSALGVEDDDVELHRGSSSLSLLSAESRSSSLSFGDIALAASLGALLWGVELLAAGGFGSAEAATHLEQGTGFAAGPAGAVGLGCTEPAAVEVRAQLAADRPSDSDWELLATIGKSEASGLAPRRGEGAARGSLHAATAGFGDTQ